MQTWLWLPLAIGSAVFAALVALFGKLGAAGLSVPVVTFVRVTFMFLFLLTLVTATGRFNDLNSLGHRALLYGLLAGVAGALSWLCYFWALKLGRISHVTAIDRLSVVFAAALAMLFLGERIGVKDGIGLILIIVGGILVAVA